jgi:hypothetical protein
METAWRVRPRAAACAYVPRGRGMRQVAALGARGAAAAAQWARAPARAWPACGALGAVPRTHHRSPTHPRAAQPQEQASGWHAGGRGRSSPALEPAQPRARWRAAMRACAPKGVLGGAAGRPAAARTPPATAALHRTPRASPGRCLFHAANEPTMADRPVKAVAKAAKSADEVGRRRRPPRRRAALRPTARRAAPRRRPHPHPCPHPRPRRPHPRPRTAPCRSATTLSASS